MVKKKTAREKVREKVTKQEDTFKALMEIVSRAGSLAVPRMMKGHEDTIIQDTTSEWGGEEDKGTKSVDRASVKRKMAKQLRFLSKLQETHKALSAKKTISKRRRISQSGTTLNDLSSLSDFLPALNISTASTTTKILRSKAKQKIVVNETKQLAAVLAHPQFKSNPFAAIQQHLTSTLPPPPPLASSKPVPKAGAKKKSSSRMKQEGY